MMTKCVNNHSAIGRPGFTMMELLVAIVIIGLLIAMILPAVQGTRETASNVSCHNRLHQLGLAMHSFEERERTFPLEIGLSVLTRNSTRPLASALDRLLADLDQSALAHRPKLPVHLHPDADPLVEIFLCPSDHAALRGTNYRVCMGDRPNDELTVEHLGIFTFNETKISNIIDGLSQTVAMSERIRSDDSLVPFQRPADCVGSGLWSLVPSNHTLTADDMWETCRSLTGTGTGYSGKLGWYWGKAEDLQTEYNHVAPPNSEVVDCGIADYSGRPPGEVRAITDSFGGGQISARSYHPGGVNCLLADGSVRFVSDAIDLGLWRALATMAGSEIIGEF